MTEEKDQEKAKVHEKVNDFVNSAAHGFSLGADEFIEQYWNLLMRYIEGKKESRNDTYLIGMQGPPGIGKTTLTAAVKIALGALGYSAVAFSIDDFYLPYNDRLLISKKHSGNPFYQISRGMPGTHRVEDLYKTLCDAKAGMPFVVPHFDKSLHSGKGDVTDTTTKVPRKTDFVILEGWCLNMRSAGREEFVKTMEKDAYAHSMFMEIDPQQKHFETVLKSASEYEKIWRLFNEETFLCPQDASFIEEWRAEQEEDLIRARGRGQSKSEVREFAKHFVPVSHFLSEYAQSKGDGSTLIIGKDHSVVR